MVLPTTVPDGAALKKKRPSDHGHSRRHSSITSRQLCARHLNLEVGEKLPHVRRIGAKFRTARDCLLYRLSGQVTLAAGQQWRGGSRGLSGRRQIWSQKLDPAGRERFLRSCGDWCLIHVWHSAGKDVLSVCDGGTG